MENKERVIAIACDHAAYDMKEAIKKHLEGLNIKYIDFGTNDGTTSVDYPAYAHKACEAIQNGAAELGILVCGTGIGMSLAANKHRGIRAACCSDTFSARLTRMHNDANVLCFGARVVGQGLGLDLVDTFLSTEYEGGRHTRRVAQITELENNM